MQYATSTVFGALGSDSRIFLDLFQREVVMFLPRQVKPEAKYFNDFTMSVKRRQSCSEIGELWNSCRSIINYGVYKQLYYRPGGDYLADVWKGNGWLPLQLH